ncbi:MAG: hypothetical protein ACRCV0_06505 [Brevinema sp.]
MKKLFLVFLLLGSMKIHAVNYNASLGIYGATKGNNIDVGIMTHHIISGTNKDKGALMINIGGGYIPRTHSAQEGEILIGIGYLQEKLTLPIPIMKIKTISLGYSLDTTQRFSLDGYRGMTLAPTIHLGINRILLGLSAGYQYDPNGFYTLDRHSTFARIELSYIFGKDNNN